MDKLQAVCCVLELFAVSLQSVVFHCFRHGTALECYMDRVRTVRDYPCNNNHPRLALGILIMKRIIGAPPPKEIGLKAVQFGFKNTIMLDFKVCYVTFT